MSKQPPGTLSCVLMDSVCWCFGEEFRECVQKCWSGVFRSSDVTVWMSERHGPRVMACEMSSLVLFKRFCEEFVFFFKYLVEITGEAIWPRASFSWQVFFLFLKKIFEL